MSAKNLSKQKNGLSSDQVNAARAILKQVNVARICEAQSIKVSTIYNVLRDESPRVDLLNEVLKVANREIKKKKKIIEALPV